jgi:serine/threonine-protein kinase HipA
LSFIRMLIFHYLVGNADAHGKNYALLYRGKAPDLAPLYDVVCTAAYPRLAKKLAMAIGKRGVPDTIQLKHWLTLVPDTSTGQRMLVRELADIATRVITEADELLLEFAAEGIAHDVLKTVRSVIETRSGHMMRAAETG